MRSLLILVFLPAFVTSNVCSKGCRCSSDQLTVDCSSLGLTTLPTDLPDKIQVLTVRNNRISSLTRHDLSALKKYPLDVLLITDSHLRHVEENILDELPSLKRLSLARNKLRRVPPLASTHSDLLSLNLKGNHIRTIDGDAFTGFPRLRQLDISENRLQSVPSQITAHIGRVEFVLLHGNPWNCDCRIRQLVEVTKNLANYTEAYCMNPRGLRFIPLVEVTEGVTTCQVAAHIEWDVKEEKKYLCPKHTEQPSIWLYNGNELDSSSLEEYRLEGDYLIVSAKVDSKLLSCTSDYDHVPHRVARQIGQPPKFTYKPRDNSYREGAEIKINCEAIGYPKPIITWYRNGEVLQSTRQHELSLSNNVLRIYPFLEADSGRYTCAATNLHGRVEHTVNIEVVSSIPPSIYDGPENVKVQNGGRAQFVCRARGTPIPEYTWSFDGAIIAHIKGRLMVSDDGTLLTISPVTKADEGTYSCMAGNPVGAMSADARLTVEGGEPKRELIDDDLLLEIAAKARANVEKAVEKTRTQLSQDRVTNTKDLKKLIGFTVPAQAVALTKAREIYEEAVRLVHVHVEKGMTLSVDELHPSNVSYEAVLHVTHMQTLMGLSGCTAGQFKNPCTDSCFHKKYRSFDGQCNNERHPMWGVSQMPLSRLIPPVYENGFNTPVGWEQGRLYHGYPMPNVREVSRQLIATETVTPHSKLSSFVMQWGQFLDHDMTHTAQALSRHSYSTGAFCNRTCENVDPCFNIPLSRNDPKLNSANSKYPCIEFERSAAVCGSGETSLVFQRVTYREQMNILTSFIDASNVYGSSEVQAREVRETYDDKGMLRFDISSDHGKAYLPFEKDSSMDCRRNFSEENPIRCFLAGDLRANEQLALTATHTLFLREHNRIAGELLAFNNFWDGEVIYHETRKIVGAMMQHITYSHWLPVVFGGQEAFDKFIGPYKGYNPTIDPAITNAFATAAFRFGHTIINPELYRLGNDFNPIPNGHISLHKAFFTPELILSEGGIDPLLRGLFASPLKHPKANQLLNMELIEKLFHKYHEVALDLASMNIQRGRDHGLPGYMAYRRYCNLPAPSTWHEMLDIVKNQTVLMKLKGLYGHPNNIDLWVGGVIEEKLPDALFGPTFACIIGDQFKKLRDGDRFWYENQGVFSSAQLSEIKKASLSRVLCDNGDNIDRVQKDVFMYPGREITSYDECSRHQKMNLTPWRNCCDVVCPTMLDKVLRSRHRGSRLHGCTERGIWRPEGARWSPRGENCTECVCQGSRVWCSTKEDCSDLRSPFSFK